MSKSLHQVACAFTVLIAAEGCDRFSRQPQLNRRTEADVMERFVSAAPGQIEKPWKDLEAELGRGKSISYEEFKKITGYKSSKPPHVECRIWRNSQGEWLAVAYDPDTKSVSGIKSNMRR